MNTNHTILLLEDEIDSGEMLANFLEINNFKVYWAKDGQEAVQIIENNAQEIALAILDIMVPKKRWERNLYIHKKTSHYK